jgi:hypothetical protein
MNEYKEIKEDWLNGVECDWKIYESVDEVKNENIVSVSYFSKKNKSNEKKKKYFEGLKKLYYDIRKILPHYTLRIYCDKSVIKNVIEFYKKVNKNHIEIYQYQISLLLENGQNEIHKGTTGTLIRFLPLFNFELHQCSKKIVLDIDTYDNHLFLELIKKIENEKIYFCYRSHPYYYQHKRLSCVESEIQFEYLVAHFIYQINEIDKYIFFDFLKRYFVNIQNVNIKKIKNRCGMISEFEYGIDEIFMNESFLPKQFEILDTKNEYTNQNYTLDIVYYLSNYDYKYVFLDFLEEIKKLNQTQMKKYHKDIQTFFRHFFEVTKLTQISKFKKSNGNYDILSLISFIENDQSQNSMNFYQNDFIPLFKNNKMGKKIQKVFQQYFYFDFISNKLNRLKSIIDIYKENTFLIIEMGKNRERKIKYIKYKSIEKKK